VLVRDHLELRPIFSARAALLHTSDESFGKGRIISSRTNGHGLPLNPTKILETLGVCPWVGLSKHALRLVQHCAQPLRSAIIDV